MHCTDPYHHAARIHLCTLQQIGSCSGDAGQQPGSTAHICLHTFWHRIGNSELKASDLQWNAARLFKGFRERAECPPNLKSLFIIIIIKKKQNTEAELAGVPRVLQLRITQIHAEPPRKRQNKNQEQKLIFWFHRSNTNKITPNHGWMCEKRHLTPTGAHKELKRLLNVLISFLVILWKAITAFPQRRSTHAGLGSTQLTQLFH